jgi:integrase
MALTDIACRNAKPAEKQYKLTDARGLFLLVHPNGSKYWRGAYRFNGSQKTLALGVYPAMSVVSAREEWGVARDKLGEGIDPGAQRKIDKAVRQVAAGQTFEKTAREWHEMKKNGWKERTARDQIHRLEVDIFPQIGSIPVSEITPPVIVMALRQIERRGSLEMCARLRVTCTRVFNYAMACGYIQTNPAAPVKEALSTHKPGHFASIEVEELPKFVDVLYRNEARLYPATRIAVHIMLLTFVRTTELIEVPWSELDLDNAMWIVPGERMKKERDHMVPLSRQVVELFREMLPISGGSRYVFPNVRYRDQPMSNGAILMALRRMGYQGKMTGHGFRALGMSAIKQELGYPHEIVDLQLAHVKKNKVDAAYDRAKFLKERTKMMQEWADYLDKLREGADVLPIRSATS